MGLGYLIKFNKIKKKKKNSLMRSLKAVENSFLMIYLFD